MRYLASHEHLVRGTFNFPLERYFIDAKHPRYEMPFHWHMEYELMLVLNGRFELSVEGETFVLCAGDSMLISEGAIHGGTPQNCEYECVVFDLERFLPGASVCGQKLSNVLIGGARLQCFFEKDGEAARIVDALFKAMQKEASGYEFATTGLLWQLLGIILRDELYQTPVADAAKIGRRTEQLKNVLRRIRADYAETLTLNLLAAEAAMAPKYFCRVFRQVTGRTPVDYLNYYRVECAAELLISTNSSVTEIALQCGFNDLSYFNRMFRRHKKMPARAYRQAHEI